MTFMQLEKVSELEELNQLHFKKSSSVSLIFIAEEIPDVEDVIQKLNCISRSPFQAGHWEPAAHVSDDFLAAASRATWKKKLKMSDCCMH